MRRIIAISLGILIRWGELFAFSLWWKGGLGLSFPQQYSPAEYCEHYERQGDILLLNPQCLLEGKLPKLSLRDRADAFWGFVDDLGEGYRSDQSFSVYVPEKVSLKAHLSLYPLSDQRRRQLLIAYHQGKKVKIPLVLFAEYAKSWLSFFLADKDISRLKPCTKQNYLLAFEQLDGRVIRAGEYFNFNHYLFWLRGYCQGIGGLDLGFYGGVCGVASQLFRAALTSPVLEVPMRHSHNDRFSAYYGEHIQGDDAAVYETSKQLIIKNISPHDILIKTFQKWEKTALVLLVRAEDTKDKWVEIQKTYPRDLQVKLLKEVYQKTSNSFFPKNITLFPALFAKEKAVIHLSSESFESQYLQVNPQSR